MQLPEPYIVNKFYQFAGSPKYNRFTKNYQASCPICREGKSWLKKRRLYYIPQHNSIFCHNCGWKGTPYKWIKEVSGLTFNEIMLDSLNYDTIDVNKCIPVSQAVEVPTLPGDCINLYSEAQTAFYKDNEVVQKALQYIKQRKMDVGINKPDTLYMCFDHNQVHDKRIIIPFFDDKNKITFYQSRSFLSSDVKAKYLSKSCSERTLFNANKISQDCEHIFVFEGPINAFFTKNSIAVGGIQENSLQLFSNKQHEQMELLCKFFKIVWVLDSQWLDEASYKKTQKLMQMNQTVFIWPELIGAKFKDFNDVVMHLDVNEIDAKFIINNSYNGLQAQIKFNQIRPQFNQTKRYAGLSAVAA